MSAQDEGSPLGFIILGLAAAALGGGIWAGITIMTGYEVGYVAWGIGALVGFGVAVGAQGHPAAPAAAAGLAVLGLVIGKLAIAQFGGVGAFVDEISGDQELMAEALLELWVANGEIDADVVAAIEGNGPVTPAIEDKIRTAYTDAVAHAATLSGSERTEVAEAYAKTLLGSVSFADRLNLGLFDFLWFGLAVVTAFRVASNQD